MAPPLWQLQSHSFLQLTCVHINMAPLSEFIQRSSFVAVPPLWSRSHSLWTFQNKSMQPGEFQQLPTNQPTTCQNNTQPLRKEAIILLGNFQSPSYTARMLSEKTRHQSKEGRGAWGGGPHPCLCLCFLPQSWVISHADDDGRWSKGWARGSKSTLAPLQCQPCPPHHPLQDLRLPLFHFSREETHTLSPCPLILWLEVVYCLLMEGFLVLHYNQPPLCPLLICPLSCVVWWLPGYPVMLFLTDVHFWKVCLRECTQWLTWMGIHCQCSLTILKKSELLNFCKKSNMPARCKIILFTKHNSSGTFRVVFTLRVKH